LSFLQKKCERKSWDAENSHKGARERARSASSEHREHEHSRKV
jgi:hypothetical protein